MLVWAAAALGGAFTWSYPPIVAALAVAAWRVRPAVAAAPTRTMDVALLCCLAWMLLQLVPLPASFRDVVSPGAAAVDAAVRLDGFAARSRPLSINPELTRRGALVAAMLLAMFWTTREVCRWSGPRRLIRAVAWTGLALSVAAVWFLGTTPGMVYGVWYPGEGTRPYGPFVNRNHMGTWLVMSTLLITGYVFARFQDRARHAPLVAAVDSLMVWLVGAAGAMAVAVIVSLSRSAAIGTAAGGVLFAALAVRHGGRARWGLLAAGVAAVAVLLSIPRTADLGRRFNDPGTTATWGRIQIWRETLPIVRDFPITGTGVGSYSTAMLVYQRSDRSLFFNQAHNHYLQLAVEGGLLLLLPLTIAFAAGAGAAARRVWHDRSPMFWIRGGAVAGLAGALVQSFWETGLRLPANGLLFAALWGIAVHDPEPEDGADG